jgi:hypothetical protein
MKKKPIKKEKKENKQVVEIHIYVHQGYTPAPYYNPNGGGGTGTYPNPNITWC